MSERPNEHQEANPRPFKAAAVGVKPETGPRPKRHRRKVRQVKRSVRLRTLVGLGIMGVLVLKGFDAGLFDPLIKQLSRSKDSVVNDVADWLTEALSPQPTERPKKRP